MPSYKLPKEKTSKEDGESALVCGSPMNYERMVRVPVNEEILGEFDIGDKIEMTLMGEVTELRKNDSEYEKSRSLEIKITEVMAYPEGYKTDDSAHKGNKKGDMVKEGMKEMAKGFKKINSHNSDY
jgi:hypothetical protein